MSLFFKAFALSCTYAKRHSMYSQISYQNYDTRSLNLNLTCLFNGVSLVAIPFEILRSSEWKIKYMGGKQKKKKYERAVADPAKI